MEFIPVEYEELIIHRIEEEFYQSYCFHCHSACSNPATPKIEMNWKSKPCGVRNLRKRRVEALEVA